VQREVENMSMRDLKEKIVKISQLYKVERVKNRDLDRTVKAMEPQISNTMQLNSIIAAQKNNIQILNQKIDRMVKEHERINVYKETIRKQ
jgi:predicted oxidoreductase